MDANVLNQFEVTFNGDLSALLWDCTTKYESLVKNANAQREGLAEAESRVRNSWGENPANIKIAETMIESVINIFTEAMDAHPELSAALYLGVTKRLADRVKGERDYFVSKVLKDSRKVPEVPENLEGLRKLIVGLFTSCEAMGFLPVDYPIEYDKDGKNKRPKLSRKPYETRKPSASTAISKRFVWTIDGETVVDSPAGIRNKLGVDKVKDIWDYFDLEGRNNIMGGQKYSATIKGKVVTFQVTEPSNSDEPTDVELDEIDDDGTED